MKSLLVILTILGLTYSTTNAQDSNEELVKKLVEKNILTQSEANEIMKEPGAGKQTFFQTTNKVRDSFNTPYMRFGGYGMYLYQYNQYAKNHHDMGTRVIFMSMSGNLTEHFRYFILGELSNPMIYEFYGEWMPSQAFKLRGGQYKIPLTFENQISLTELETVSNTRSVSSLIGMAGDPLQYSDSRGINKTGRDIGIQASGSFLEMDTHYLLHYAAGVFQGTGINVRENNNAKDFSGSITLQPTKDFRVAGGYYAGKATVVLPIRFPSGNTTTFSQDNVRNRWTLSADYKSERLYARTEWIHANDGGIKKEGLHGTVQYYILPNKLNLVGKVDYFNNNKKRNSEVVDYIAAINYYFYERCRFMLNYTYSDYSKNWGNSHLSENLIQAQMQIVF